jgi:hypothetical protein
MVFPFSFIDSAIRKFIDSLTAVLIVFPKTFVNSPIRVIIATLSMHPVLLPLSLVHLFSYLTGRYILDSESTFSVFGFDAFV